MLANINAIECDLKDLDVKVFSKGWVRNQIDEKQVCGGRLWLFKIVLLLISYKPTLIFIHSRCYLPLSPLLRAANIRVVFYGHASYRKNNFLFKVFKCDEYIAVSKSAGEVLLSQIKNDVTVISNPVNIYSVTVKSVTGSLVFNYVGALQEWKGIDKFVELLSQYCMEYSCASVLNIVGEGPLRASIESAAMNDLLKINFLGYQKKPYETLDPSNIHIIPSLEEGFGIVAVEALLNGSPILYSMVPALEEILSKDELSRGFDIFDYDSFSASLNELVLKCSLEEISSDFMSLRASKAKASYGLESFRAKYVQFVGKDIVGEKDA